MKKIEKYLRDEKGAVTTVVVVTLLFFVIILSTTYIISATLRKSQLESEFIAKETYERDFENIDEICSSLFPKVVDGVEILEGFCYVGGKVDSGLVISDNVVDANAYAAQDTVGTELKGNQYVWIEVPRNAIVYPTAGLNITNFTTEEYTKIETDLHTYTNTYRNGTRFTDTYYADYTTGWFTDANAYNTAKNKMLKSVYQNGGFWIGRYEAGIETPRTASGTATTTPLSKANLYPYNYVSRTQAKVLAEQVLGTSGKHTSSLMFGVQWDLVIKYLETKGVTQEELKGTTTGSTNWGNYANAEILITNTNAKYAIYNRSSYTLGTWNPVPNNYTKPNSGTDNWVLLSTGANETRSSKQHICDLAGNEWEWTLEYTSYTGEPCARRGGNYDRNGSSSPASVRSSDNATDGNVYTGFRVSLY